MSLTETGRSRPTSAIILRLCEQLAVPMRLQVGDRALFLLSTTTVFGTPREVTLPELAIAAFYPGDEETRAALTGV